MRIAALWAILVATWVALGPAANAQPQTQSNLPPAENQYVDANGAPLAGGSVSYYVPGTLTPKVTDQDPFGNTADPTTITLDSAGPGRNVRKRSVEMPASFEASASAMSGASIGSSVSWNVP
jgi:hypothetical protein